MWLYLTFVWRLGSRKWLTRGAHDRGQYHHQTPRYVAIVREVRAITPDVTLLSANTGLVPTGMDDIDPALNAVQSMVATKKGGAWKIALFQNTPAAFHERPDAAKMLTEQLRAVLKAKPVPQ